VLSGVLNEWSRKSRVLRGFYEFNGFGAGVLAPQMGENLVVFVKPTPRKHRVWQCLQKAGRPRAKQH
jgi:hypothetical protein